MEDGAGRRFSDEALTVVQPRKKPRCRRGSRRYSSKSLAGQCEPKTEVDSLSRWGGGRKWCCCSSIELRMYSALALSNDRKSRGGPSSACRLHPHPALQMHHSNTAQGKGDYYLGTAPKRPTATAVVVEHASRSFCRSHPPALTSPAHAPQRSPVQGIAATSRISLSIAAYNVISSCSVMFQHISGS